MVSIKEDRVIIEEQKGKCSPMLCVRHEHNFCIYVLFFLFRVSENIFAYAFIFYSL